MCRACGAIVGSGQDQCAVCGASVTPGPASQQRQRPLPDRETMKFARAVLDRPYKFTIVLLVANLFVFLLMWQASGMSSHALWELPEPVLVGFGAKLNWLIDNKHQFWRFVTPMFVHVNLPHVLVNMYSLWVVGPYVEKLYGSAKFIVFWVLTGIAGVAASYLTVVGPGTPVSTIGRFLLKTQDVPSAGASGALFGLVGVLFVFGIKFRHELPEGFKRAFGTGMLPIIMINLFIGYLGRGFIDNAAHLGGLVSGAALALVVDYRRPGERPSIAVIWRVLQVAALAIVAVSFLEVAEHFQDPLPAPFAVPSVHVSNKTGEFIVYVKAMSDAQEAFFEMMKNNDPKGVDNAVKELESAPHLDEKADELKETLKALLIEATQFKAKPTPSSERDRKNALQEENELVQGFAAWSQSYNQWLKTTGKIYGGLMDLSPNPPAENK
jgi:rhomboid protease GluP